METEGKQAVETSKEELSKAPAYKLSFFLFIHENKRNALGVLTPKHGVRNMEIIIDLQDIIANN